MRGETHSQQKRWFLVVIIVGWIENENKNCDYDDYLVSLGEWVVICNWNSRIDCLGNDHNDYGTSLWGFLCELDLDRFMDLATDDCKCFKENFKFLSCLWSVNINKMLNFYLEILQFINFYQNNFLKFVTNKNTKFLSLTHLWYLRIVL